MTSLTLSQTAIFSLDQLAKQVYRESGLRCKLADKRCILRLLKFSSISASRAIRYRFSQFLKKLSYQQLKLLLSYGIQLPQRILSLSIKHHKTLKGFISRFVKRVTPFKGS